MWIRIIMVIFFISIIVFVYISRENLLSDLNANLKKTDDEGAKMNATMLLASADISLSHHDPIMARSNIDKAIAIFNTIDGAKNILVGMCVEKIAEVEVIEKKPDLGYASFKKSLEMIGGSNAVNKVRNNMKRDYIKRLNETGNNALAQKVDLE